MVCHLEIWSDVDMDGMRGIVNKNNEFHAATFRNWIFAFRDARGRSFRFEEQKRWIEK